MNFNYQQLFNLYNEQFQSFNSIKDLYIKNFNSHSEHNKRLDLIFYDLAYYFSLNDNIQNLNENSYKFTDILYNHLDLDLEVCTIFHNINK